MEVTSKYPRVHGAPIHLGNPVSYSKHSFYVLFTIITPPCSIVLPLFDQEQIGIADVNSPDFGEAVDLKEGEIPVFWACGVTPQAVVMKTK